MKYFKLPDLGEGLQEAEIVEWHISPGDTVAVDQIIVSVETAKAIVDVPSPQAGEIAALFGAEGDIIHTNEPLVEYAGENDADTG
ncbi:MAG: 2-oxo acid dehydrogenase subunit E2, partial [Pseudomonadales bacterium]|nr:2-oxo acid dehydrogenase subunit E2 [Pseudomonadales bacterium]